MTFTRVSWLQLIDLNSVYANDPLVIRGRDYFIGIVIGRIHHPQSPSSPTTDQYIAYHLPIIIMIVNDQPMPATFDGHTYLITTVRYMCPANQSR